MTSVLAANVKEEKVSSKEQLALLFELTKSNSSQKEDALLPVTR